VLSNITSAQHFEMLYTNATRHLQPLDATKQLYPFALQEFRRSTVSTAAPQILHYVGALELVDGRSILVARSPRDPPGVLAYGPYETLQPGRYVARFVLWGGGTIGGGSGYVEVSEFGGEKLAGLRTQPLSASGTTTMDVPFTNEGVFPLELRVYFSEGTLGVHSVKARLVAPLRRVGGEVWKAILWLGAGAGIAAYWARRRPKGRVTQASRHRR
jgi:hypothetical protein